MKVYSLRGLDILGKCSIMFIREIPFVIFNYLTVDQVPSENASSLKGKILLL